MSSPAGDISAYIVSQIGNSFSAGGKTWQVYPVPPNDDAETYVWWQQEYIDELDLGTKETPIYPYEVEFTVVQRVGQYANTLAVNEAVKYIQDNVAPRGTNLTSGDHQLISTRVINYNESVEYEGQQGDGNQLLVRKLVIRILAEQL